MSTAIKESDSISRGTGTDRSQNEASPLLDLLKEISKPNSTANKNSDPKLTSPNANTNLTEEPRPDLTSLNGNNSLANLDPSEATDRSYGSTKPTDGKGMPDIFKMLAEAIHQVMKKPDSSTEDNKNTEKTLTDKASTDQAGESKLDSALDEAGVSEGEFEKAAHAMGPELKKDAEKMQAEGADSEEILSEVTDKVLESIGSDLDGLSPEAQMQLTNFCAKCLGGMADQVSSDVSNK
ncbi:MAG: hypothetical protein ACRCWJ_16920 [Casimicrobium sp.]